MTLLMETSLIVSILMTLVITGKAITDWVIMSWDALVTEVTT